MSLLIGMDFIDNSASFTTAVRKGPDGQVQVKAVCLSAIAANTPVTVTPSGSGYMATALAASVYAYVGVSTEGAVSSGSNGWFAIRGHVEDVQGGSGSMTGAAGTSVYWGATALGATGSAYIGDPTIGQIGILTTTESASTTFSMYLTGLWATPIA